MLHLDAFAYIVRPSLDAFSVLLKLVGERITRRVEEGSLELEAGLLRPGEVG